MCALRTSRRRFCPARPSSSTEVQEQRLSVYFNAGAACCHRKHANNGSQRMSPRPIFSVLNPEFAPSNGIQAIIGNVEVISEGDLADWIAHHQDRLAISTPATRLSIPLRLLLSLMYPPRHTNSALAARRSRQSSPQRERQQRERTGGETRKARDSHRRDESFAGTVPSKKRASSEAVPPLYLPRRSHLPLRKSPPTRLSGT